MKLDSLLLVGVSAGCTVAANLMMRSGVTRAGGFATAVSGLDSIKVQLFALAQQPLFDVGVILYGIAALVWFRVISTDSLSTSYPILVSLTFTLVTLGAVVLFQEQMSTQKALGLMVILGGVWLVTGA